MNMDIAIIIIGFILLLSNTISIICSEKRYRRIVKELREIKSRTIDLMNIKTQCDVGESYRKMKDSIERSVRETFNSLSPYGQVMKDFMDRGNAQGAGGWQRPAHSSQIKSRVSRQDREWAEMTNTYLRQSREGKEKAQMIANDT